MNSMKTDRRHGSSFEKVPDARMIGRALSAAHGIPPNRGAALKPFCATEEISSVKGRGAKIGDQLRVNVALTAFCRLPCRVKFVIEILQRRDALGLA